MPDDPGALHRAAEIIKSHGGNIHRVDYDRRIDPHVVFWEIDADEGAPELIKQDLQKIGYLQTSLATLRFLKFHVYLPDKAGMLFDFLGYTTGAGANIAFLDFDTKGKHPGALTVALTLDNDAVANSLLEQLKLRYRLEILEYDVTGKKLDDTVFYLRFAQEIRELIGEAGDEFLMNLLHDANHIAQELTSQGKDPKVVFDSILRSGRTLQQTRGPGFYADVQRIKLSPEAQVLCFQLPCGGSVYIVESKGEMVMIDSGFGIYHHEIMDMLTAYGLDLSGLKRIYMTHADADHAGGGGFFDVPTVMHPGSQEIIRYSNRAYGSKMEGSILGAVYTTLINLFSGFNPPTNVEVLSAAPSGEMCGLPVLGEFTVGGLKFKVLESLGGHQHGHLFFLCEDEGLLFTGDCLINFGSFTEEREKFATLATILMNSVNVDSERASKERKCLLGIAKDLDAKLGTGGKRLLICGGHGAVSTLESGKLTTFGEVMRYAPDPSLYPARGA